MTKATATKWAFCTIDSTRDVVRSLHRSEAAAQKKLDAVKRRAPANAITHLMYCVREVEADAQVGERLHR